MHYSLFVKTDFGVPCFNIDFDYDEKDARFTNIVIVNLADDIHYRVDTYFPVKGIMKIEAEDLFNTGVMDYYACDVYIRIPEPDKINCQQAFELDGLFWNLQTVDNGGTYELIEYSAK